MRQIVLSKQAQKFLKKLPAKQARQIAGAVMSLKTDPQPQDSKQLRGVLLWRIDTGEYRAVYDFDKKQVTVYIIGKRNDDAVYRLLQRKLKG